VADVVDEKCHDLPDSAEPRRPGLVVFVLLSATIR
jgi:hypothetical protein